MDSIANKKVQEYKNNTVKKAEDLIINSFPLTILKLNEILESSDFRKRKLSQIHQTLNIPKNPGEFYAKHEKNNDGHAISMNDHDGDGDGKLNDLPKKRKLDDGGGNQVGTKVYTFPYGSVPCNKRLCELIDLAKPHIQQLLEDANLLKMWISYLIPKIEDGNNFGVSVQEETLGEIQSVESEAAAFFDQIPRYFISRSKIITKVAKYPHIDDYRKAVEEIDEREYLSVWLAVCEVRNRYCALHDIVLKNIDKIRTPRSTNAESLY